MASLLDIGKNLKNKVNPIIQGILDNTDIDEPKKWGQNLRTGMQNVTYRAQNPYNPFKEAGYISRAIPSIQRQTNNRVANFSLNTGKPFFSGINTIGSGINNIRRGNILQGAAQSVVGAGQTMAPFTSLYQGANLIASSPKPQTRMISPQPQNLPQSSDYLRRFSSGIMRGIGQDQDIASNVQRQNSLKLPILGAIDPAEAVGQTIGFVKNPINSKLFKATEKILPATMYSQPIQKWLAITATRGGLEGLLLGLSRIPENATAEQKVKFLVTQMGQDAVMEILGRGILDTSAKGFDIAKNTEVIDDVIKKLFKGTQSLNAKVTTMKIDPKTGERISMPLWKYQLDKMGLGLSTKDINELSPEDYAKYKPQSTVGGVQPTKGDITQSTVGGVSKPQGASDTNPLLPPLKAQMDQKLPPQADSATKQIQSVPQKTEPQISKGVVEGSVKESLSSPDIIPPTDPIQKIITALKEAKPIRGAQEGMYRKARSQKFAKMMSARGRVSGEKGFFAEKGALKGELPKAQFESLRDSLKQSDIDTLFNKINEANIGDWEKITAKTGLAKILGQEGGSVPTKGEIALLDEVYGREFTDALLDKRPLMQKLMATMGDVLNLPRSLMASVDMSAPLRQGVFLIGRPKQWAPAFKEMVKSFGSEKAYQAVMDDIAAKPTYKLMREHKLALTQANSKLATGEEAFMSNLAERIPGIGRVVKASDRAYTAFLNKLRADTFEDMVMRGRDIGLDDDPVFLQSAADFVNAATGRGKLPGALANSAQALNGVFFSPRLMASRLTLLNPVSYVTMHPQVRKEALKSLFTFAGTGMTVLTLAQLAGAEVGKDPRSSDFGKIKIGNTRYDIWGGFQQYIKAASQILSGKLISSTTGKEYTLGEGYKPITRLDIATKFFESKEAPIASFITSMLRGENAIGDKFSLPEELISRMTPMMIQDMYDLQKEWGPKGMLMGIPGIFGVGSQTYGKQIPVQETTEAGNPTIKLKSVPGFAEDVVRKFTKEPVSNIPQDQWQGIVDAKNEEKQKGLIKEQLKQSGGAQVVGNSYIYINDKGEAKEIDLDRIQNIPTYPTLTGDANLDKEAISRYKSTLSSITNDVYDLWEMGKLTTEEASALLDNVQTAYNKTKKAKKPKKITVKKAKTTPFKLAKSKGIRFSQKKLPKPKITKTKGYRILTYTDNAPKVKVSKPVVRWS